MQLSAAGIYFAFKLLHPRRIIMYKYNDNNRNKEEV